MTKRLHELLILLIIATIITNACNTTIAPTTFEKTEQPTEPSTSEPAPTQKTEEEGGSSESGSADVALVEEKVITREGYGLVTDIAGINDNGLNELAWQGLERAAEKLDANVKYLESEQQTDYEKYIAQFVEENYKGIVTTGFLLADATKAAAKTNPDLPFITVDFPSQTPNTLGLLFNIDQPAFMAGYLAAGMSKTGTVCTYGAVKAPTIVSAMVGFENGVTYYNSQHESEVEIIGWQTDPATAEGGDGYFIRTFSEPAEGARAAENLRNEGCDIIFPIAGEAGLGSAEMAQESGELLVIGTEIDMAATYPDLAGVYLTSVMKSIDVAVFEAVKSIEEGSFEGGANYRGSLANGGVGLAPLREFEESAPAALQEELEEIEAGLIEGKISTGWPVPLRPVTPESSAEVTEEVDTEGTPTPEATDEPDSDDEPASPEPEPTEAVDATQEPEAEGTTDPPPVPAAPPATEEITETATTEPVDIEATTEPLRDVEGTAEVEPTP